MIFKVRAKSKATVTRLSGNPELTDYLTELMEATTR